MINVQQTINIFENQDKANDDNDGNNKTYLEPQLCTKFRGAWSVFETIPAK